ncbi:unnamed protein product [Peniophora sp. CBMAI 1063]|nr:unnamed protein product [Peniophora sp. CBMAI 1063]
MLTAAISADMHSLHHQSSGPRPVQSNLLIDGFIAYTFRPPSAELYLSRLLSGVAPDRLDPIFNQRSVLVPRTCLYRDFHDSHDSQDLVLLDYLPDPKMGTVVPQRLPTPGAHQRLHTPVFFTQPRSQTDTHPDTRSSDSAGIALLDALNLDGSLVFKQLGAIDADNVILMLNWPGYPDYARKQMLWDPKSGRKTDRRLLQQVAFFIASFLESPPAKPGGNDTVDIVQWTVGPAWKELVTIVGLIHVSSTPNVWMPIIRTGGGFFRIY